MCAQQSGRVETLDPCPPSSTVAGVHHGAEQEEEQRGDRGHRRPGDAAVPLPVQRAAGVGRADEEAEDVALLLAARRGEHGQGAGGLQALPLHGLRGQEERRGGRHVGGAQGVLHVRVFGGGS